MLRAYKVEIQPNHEQIEIIQQTIGTYRWVYNKFIEINQIRSSQICNQCGNRQKMPLNKRVYKCENCGTIEDRDINASINLKQAKEYTVLV